MESRQYLSRMIQANDFIILIEVFTQTASASKPISCEGGYDILNDENYKFHAMY
jgi:hypothetical protein